MNYTYKNNNMNDYVLYNPDYSINYCHLHNQNNYAQCLHLQPRLLTTERIISVPTKTPNELISSKSTHTIKITQEQGKRGDRLLRNREWDNRYYLRNKQDRIRNNSWDILNANTIYNSQSNNYHHFTTYSNYIETTYYDTSYNTSNRSRYFERQTPYSKHQQRRLKSADVNLIYDTQEHTKPKRNKYAKNDKRKPDNELQAEFKKESETPRPPPQKPPPPAPPISEDLLKSIQQPSGILNRVKVVKSIPHETGVTYDAVVDELKNKLQTLKKHSTDSAIGFFDKFSNKPRKENEKIKEKIKEPSFADMLKQVQLKPSKKKIEEKEDKKNPESSEEKKENNTSATDKNETSQNHNQKQEKQDLESSPLKSPNIKIIGNQTFNINMNIQNDQNIQIVNGDLTNNVTSFSTRNLFTKEINNYQQRDREIYQNAFRLNKNENKINENIPTTKQKASHEFYDINSIGFKYDVFKMIFSNSKLLKNKLNVKNNCFNIENNFYDALAFSK